MEHAFEENFLSCIVQIVELQFEGEAAHDRGIQIDGKVGRSDHDAVEVLHLMQQFIDLRYLPVAGRAFAVLKHSVDFIEKENRVLLLRFGKCLLDRLFSSADVHVQQVASHFDDDFGVQHRAEILDEFGLSRSRSSGEQQVHARTVNLVLLAVQIVADCADDVFERNLPLDVESGKRVVFCRKHLVFLRGNPEEFAVRTHQLFDEPFHLFLAGSHLGEILQGERNAARADRIEGGQLGLQFIGNQLFQIHFADVVVPDHLALRIGERFKADGVIEAPAAGFIQGFGGRVGDPDGRNLAGIKHHVEASLVSDGYVPSED